MLYFLKIAAFKYQNTSPFLYHFPNSIFSIITYPNLTTKINAFRLQNIE